MRISAAAMNAALGDYRALNYKTNVASAYDTFLALKWTEAHPTNETPWRSVARAVDAIFVIYPDNPLGRLRPTHYDWLQVADSGRKTVWLNNTRGTKLSTTLLVGNNIRNGLLPNAVQILDSILPPHRASWQSLATLVLRNNDFPDGADWSSARTALLTELSLTSAELDAISAQQPLGAPLLDPAEPWSGETIPEDLRPSESEVIQVAESSSPGSEMPLEAPTPSPAVSISVDTRVARMLRLALASTSSILLVGPPGTGKGTLLKWAFARIAASPSDYGFEPGFVPNPLWRTPDESWTAFDLIGGLTPDEHGVLKWSDGALLNALSDDRWLILDETNRGDMDKIMGPLLTWLSDQEVEIGRSEAHDGVPLHVGWTTERASAVEESSNARRYLAGADFRLIGTYNPQDAQRVFRFGQALSRRFVVVPVPAIRPGQFTQLLSETYPGLQSDATAAISGLYSAHLADLATALGPAVFLRMARYLLRGLRTYGQTHSAATDLSTSGASAVDGSEDASEVETPLLDELLAEAYVMGVGRYLAGFDDRTFDALGDRVVGDEGGLPEGQWTWIKSQRDVLS